MEKWKSLLNKDPTNWLLEKNNPSVRYLTLTEILNKSKNDDKVIATKDEIMKKWPVPKMEKIDKNGGIGNE